jgi:amino acid transporter
MLTSDAVAFTFAHKLSPVFGIIMPLLVAISCFGSINGQVFGASRVLFSIAREKQMPNFLSFVNRDSQTPIPAILLRAFLGLLMLLLPTSIEPLLNCLLFVEWIYYLAMFVAVIFLRWKMPHLPRPYKVPLVFPILMIVISLYFIATPFFVNPVESAIGLSVLMAGIPVYYVFLVKQWVPRFVTRFLSKVTYMSYLLCNVVEPAIPKSFARH